MHHFRKLVIGKFSVEAAGQADTDKRLVGVRTAAANSDAPRSVGYTACCSVERQKVRLANSTWPTVREYPSISQYSPLDLPRCIVRMFNRRIVPVCQVDKVLIG